MKKAVYIGELALNIALGSDGKAEIGIGDWAVSAATIDGRMGVPTLWIGEVAANAVGDHIVKALENYKVDCTSVDRFDKGLSPVRVIGEGADSLNKVDHSRYPSAPFKVLWPRIDEGDIVIYGSYMTLDERDHARLLELLHHAKARKATLVYLPYYEPHQVPRVTRVMPAVFDCLELADLVIAREADIKAIFGDEDIDSIFRNHILFYCRRYLNIDAGSHRLRFFDGDRSWTLDCRRTANTELQWSAGILAGAVRALAEGKNDPDEIMNHADETGHSELAASVSHPCRR